MEDLGGEDYELTGFNDTCLLIGCIVLGTIVSGVVFAWVFR